MADEKIPDNSLVPREIGGTIDRDAARALVASARQTGKSAASWRQFSSLVLNTQQIKDIEAIWDTDGNVSPKPDG